MTPGTTPDGTPDGTPVGGGAGLDDLCAYLDASPSPHHAAAATVARLAGFAELDERAPWSGEWSASRVDAVPARGIVRRGGAVVAWALPPSPTPATPWRIVGAHTDSPGLRVKPRPDLERHGWRQLGVEVYGGVLANSWLDRDLGIAGRILLADGTDRLVDVAEPVARVPQLAIHLDRNVNDGLTLDRQHHLTPVWGTSTGGHDLSSFGAWIAEQAGLAGSTATWWDLCLYDVQPAAVLGADRSLLASGRLDNQVSCWAATRALSAAAEADDRTHGMLIVLNDHEEVGSASTAGAAGPLLEHVLERLVVALGGDRGDLLAALADSCCVSADNAHAIHPNYPERHDHEHAPVVGGGPAVKINANQRYATSADTAARFERACRDAGVPSQVFVSRNNVPCGSTIGPITATRLGVATVDVGVPQLSMHSARELCGVDDPIHLAAALTAFLRS